MLFMDAARALGVEDAGRYMDQYRRGYAEAVSWAHALKNDYPDLGIKERKKLAMLLQAGDRANYCDKDVLKKLDALENAVRKTSAGKAALNGVRNMSKSALRGMARRGLGLAGKAAKGLAIAGPVFWLLDGQKGWAGEGVHKNMRGVEVRFTIFRTKQRWGRWSSTPPGRLAITLLSVLSILQMEFSVAGFVLVLRLSVEA